MLSNTDAINNDKEFAENVGILDRVRTENIQLNRLNQSMAAELKTAKESPVQAKQTLEMERQKHKDTLLEVQDRLDKRLNESLAIDNQLLSKFRLKTYTHCLLS